MLLFSNECIFKSIVNVNGVVMAYATMARHAIVARMIVGNAGVPLFRLQVPRAPTMDTRQTVNATMVSTIPYKPPPSLLRAILRLVPGPKGDFARYVP